MNKNNILKIIAVFGLGNLLFPYHIRINGLFTLVFVILAYVGLDILFVKVTSFLTDYFKYTKVISLIGIITFVIGFLYFPIKISIMEKFIPGFSISGGLTLLILWFLCTNFKIETNKFNI